MRMFLRPLLTALVISSAFAAEAAPASATAPAGAAERPSPRAWLEAKVKAAHKLSQRKVEPDTPAEKQWQADGKALIDDIIDWDELTRRALGSNWRKRSKPEQKRFAGLLRKLIESSYRSRLRFAVREKPDRPKDVEVDWLEEDVKPEKAHLVAKVNAGEDSVLLGFKLRWDDRWRVYDVAIDDLSTVRTYRSNFRKIIDKEGWKGLIARLESKIADIEAGRAEFARPALEDKEG
ncbi:MAG: ABC transporter substrate-binding protein [Myxococcota bacterium]